MAGVIMVEPGFRGVVTGLTRSAHFQRATVEIKDFTGRILASATLLGSGDNVPMRQEYIPSISAWSFGPFNMSVNMIVTVEHSVAGPGGALVNSRIIQPVATVRKDPDPESPQTYVVSTLLSEDSANNDQDGCVISIFQFK